ncbi:MAG TPA: glycosyltransferase family 2 protein [Pseudolabrys sp.]|nr:glycosyltransferase family 2 protein [Pseudolabrys sp.]
MNVPAKENGAEAGMVAGLVSVILPNRNHGHYIHKALDAFLAQSRPALEIIVVDDASSDSSKDIVADYMRRDPRIRLIALAEHHGINQAVQVGFAQAKGEYLHIAGADDFVEPKFFEDCVAELILNPKAALCFSDPSEFYRESDQAILYPLYLSGKPIYFAPADLITQFARNFFHISANTAVYRAAYFRAAGGYRAELEWFSDWFVTLIAALRGGACYTPKQLTYVTIRGDSYSAVGLRNIRQKRELVQRIMGLLDAPQYTDVLPAMREAAMLPDYHVRTLFWLLRSRSGRAYVTPRLIRRVVGRYAWSFLRPLSPPRLRRALRQASSSRMSAWR